MTVQTTITIFNAKLGADRREIFLPTVIDGASYAEARSSSSSKGISSEDLRYKLRIPVDAQVQDGRTYVPEAVYRTLTDAEAAEHWTIRKGDYILTQAAPATAVLSQQEVIALAKGSFRDLIRVQEYADNTLRGSRAVQHWRIGGA